MAVKCAANSPCRIATPVSSETASSPSSKTTTTVFCPFVSLKSFSCIPCAALSREERRRTRRIHIQVPDFASVMPGRTPGGLRRKISRFERKALRIQAGRDGKTGGNQKLLPSKKIPPRSDPRAGHPLLDGGAVSAGRRPSGVEAVFPGTSGQEVSPQPGPCAMGTTPWASRVCVAFLLLPKSRSKKEEYYASLHRGRDRGRRCRLDLAGRTPRICGSPNPLAEEQSGRPAPISPGSDGNRARHGEGADQRRPPERSGRHPAAQGQGERLQVERRLPVAGSSMASRVVSMVLG